MKLDRAEGTNYNREMYKIKIDLSDSNGTFESMPQDQILVADFIFDVAVRFNNNSFEYSYCDDGSIELSAIEPPTVAPTVQPTRPSPAPTMKNSIKPKTVRPTKARAPAQAQAPAPSSFTANLVILFLQSVKYNRSNF